MRIMTNYQSKRSDGNYGSETFCVTFETDSEGAFNNIDQIADFLFVKAKAAVQRQIDGTAKTDTPATEIPVHTLPQSGNGSKPNGNGQLLVTDKQQNMIRKLVSEQFTNPEDGETWLRNQSDTGRVQDLSRRQASRIIESLLDRSRRRA